MYVLGLTGGIASGKSTVSDMLMDMGIPVVDADKISRSLMEGKTPLTDKIRQRFGGRVFYNDGTLNRQALGRIVFSDKDKLQALNSITHPEIYKQIYKKIEEYRYKGEEICILDIPLLIESGGVDMVDGVLLVYTDEKTQLSRLMERDNISEDFAKQKILSQMSYEEKREYADFVIDNRGSLNSTRSQLENIINRVRHLEESDG